MIFTKHLILLFLVTLFQRNVHGGVINKKQIDENLKNVTGNISPYAKSLFSDFEEQNLEQEILQELNHLSFRKQREIFVDLEKQHEKFNSTQKSLVSSESETLSPLNVEELKNIQKTIKSSNSSLPAIRNKRTLNLLLSLVARAMGYSLTPSNPEAEWIPRQQPQPPAQPCSTPSPPCRPSPSSTPPPCPMPSTTPSPCAIPPTTNSPCVMTPTTPPCPGARALMQPATIPPNQINANTISYPYRPARTIPLFNFAPLPAGVRVPYPPLLQPPAQQRSPCIPPQPSPSPCSTPAPSPPSCGTTPAPQMPQPCKPTTPPPPSAPCGTPPPPPPCGVTPAPSPSPCMNSPPQASKPQPCATTPAPPSASSPCTPPNPNPPPCKPSTSPPCGPPAESPPKPPKKGSIVLEYNDPIRIEIFSNDKKYLPASGRVYSGDYDDQQQDWHSHFFPSNEKTKDEDFEQEEMQEEHVEEEENDTPGQIKNYEEEDERIIANDEDEEDESETNLSVVKKPINRDIKKTLRQKAVSSKTNLVTTVGGRTNEKEDNIKYENKEKLQKMKKPKRKKWVRIVKKQRRKTKTDSNPQGDFEAYTFDNEPEGSWIHPKVYGKSLSARTYHSYDVSDVSNDSGSESTEDLGDFEKVTVNKKQIHSPALEKSYEFNINPYAHALEPEEARRAKLEKAVERYVEDYVEKQLGQELIKNTGIPKTTVFEFAPKNGPKIQTITTTVAKTSQSGPVSAKTPTRYSSSIRPNYRNPNGNTHIVKQSNYEENLNKRGNSYEAFTRKF